MKKLISSMLTLSMLTAMGVPASAAAADAVSPVVAPAEKGGSLDTRLTAVTTAVKASLPVDSLLSRLGGEQEFTGDVNDNGSTPRWDLTWSNHAGSISVTAGEDGKVYSYRLNLNDSDNRQFWGLDVSFPKADKGKALAAAQAFANRLMGEGESVTLKDAKSGSTNSMSFTGTLLFNGLPSPVDVRVQLRADDLTATSFHRADCYTSTNPEVPPAGSKTSSAQAAELLRGSLQLTPYYVLDEDGKTASLRYVREDTKNFVVTAIDGKLVDLDQVYADLVKEYRTSSPSQMSFAANAAKAEDAAAPGDEGGSASGGSRLSDTELKTIEGLKDVHNREQLDKTLRAVAALGLDGSWTLERVSYSQERKTGEISARLRYARPLTDAERKELEGDYEGELLQVTKNIIMNARTDELQSLYTTNFYQSERARAKQEQPQSAEQRAAAEQFLAAQLKEKWGKSKPYAKENENHLLYAQSVYDYLFPTNQISIQMDENNLVDSLDVNWNDKVEFIAPRTIISADAALDACMQAFDMPLCYVEYPVMENRVMGQKYVLAYAFRLGENRSFQGIDAKTGEPVWRDYDSSSKFSYSDLDGAFGRSQIEALAAYGIGLKGGTFQPKAALDQKTMLALLLSACGYEPNPDTGDGLDELYSMAYNENLVKASERNPDGAVTRIGFLRTLLGASIYGDAAKVSGIYSCPFADQASLSQSDIGYASLAYGLGIARGDDKGKLNPDSTMTRQEAAVMLYNFMMR